MTKPPPVRITRLPHASGLPLPAYESAGAAGIDLAAAVPEGETVSIAPGARMLVETGLVAAIPDGFEGQIRPRSGLAAKHGLTILNTPGTIDSDYRGEIKILLINHGDRAVPIHRGRRIAQLVIAPVTRAMIEDAGGADLGVTERGAGGFGSTGVG